MPQRGPCLLARACFTARRCRGSLSGLRSARGFCHHLISGSCSGSHADFWCCVRSWFRKSNPCRSWLTTGCSSWGLSRSGSGRWRFRRRSALVRRPPPVGCHPFAAHKFSLQKLSDPVPAVLAVRNSCAWFAFLTNIIASFAIRRETELLDVRGQHISSARFLFFLSNNWCPGNFGPCTVAARCHWLLQWFFRNHTPRRSVQLVPVRQCPSVRRWLPVEAFSSLNAFVRHAQHTACPVVISEEPSFRHTHSVRGSRELAHGSIENLFEKHNARFPPSPSCPPLVCCLSVHTNLVSRYQTRSVTGKPSHRSMRVWNSTLQLLLNGESYNTCLTLDLLNAVLNISIGSVISNGWSFRHDLNILASLNHRVS